MKKIILTLSIVALMISVNAQKSSSSSSSSGIDTHAKYMIITKTGTALDVAGGSKNKGANIQLWDKNNSTAQQFEFINAGNGFYNIKNVNSGKVLDISGGNDRTGTNIKTWDPNYSDAQKFRLVKYGSSYYIISPKGWYLSSETLHRKKGSNVFLWNKTEFALWRLVKM